MSYKSIQTDDLTKKLIYDLQNFYISLPHLEQADNFVTWEIWLEKLMLIDKRSLYIYLKNNQDKYPVKWIEFAEKYMGNM